MTSRKYLYYFLVIQKHSWLFTEWRLIGFTSVHQMDGKIWFSVYFWLSIWFVEYSWTFDVVSKWVLVQIRAYDWFVIGAVTSRWLKLNQMVQCLQGRLTGDNCWNQVVGYKFIFHFNHWAVFIDYISTNLSTLSVLTSCQKVMFPSLNWVGVSFNV